MKNILVSAIVGFIAAVIAVCLFAPKAPKTLGSIAAEQEQGANEAYERVLKTGVLRCGYAMWSPVAFLKDPNTNAYSGFVPDYLALLAKNLNIKIEYVEDAGYGAQAIEGLKTGRFDVFCTGLNKNAPRGRAVLYTDTIFFSPIYAYTRLDDHRFDTNLEILNDPQYTLSTMDGEATDTIAKNRFPKAKTFALPQNSEMSLLYSNVAQSKADVIFSDVPPADAYNKNNNPPLRLANPEPVLTYTIGMAVDNDEPKLVNMLNMALQELQASGQIKDVVKKYDPEMTGYKTPGFTFATP
jgi:polar amino acid transport system substrate-binding protein